MKRTLILVSLGLLGACGYSYDTFSNDATEAMCNKMDECGLLDQVGWTMDDCLNTSNQGASDTGS